MANKARMEQSKIVCPFTAQTIELVECAADEYGIKRWMGRVVTPKGGWYTCLFDERADLEAFLLTRNGIPPKGMKEKPKITVREVLPPAPDDSAAEEKKGRELHEKAMDHAGRALQSVGAGR